MVMCGWAVICLAGLPLFPKGSWALAAYAVFCILGFVWIVPAVLVGLNPANRALISTIICWAVIGALAAFLALAFS